MEPRFTRGEYWLLETVVEHEWDICGLIESDLELHLNKKGHGLTRTALVETLHRLLSSGLIYAESRVNFSDEVTDVISTKEQKVTYYGLTQEGGAQWEAFAAPDWQKYIRTSRHFPDDRDDSDPSIRVAICADKAMLERYFKSKGFYHPMHVSLGTEEWDSIAPWDVTYWKQLEGAHKVRFQARDVTEAQNVKWYPLPKPEWYYSLWCAWQ